VVRHVSLLDKVNSQKPAYTFFLTPSGEHIVFLAHPLFGPLDRDIMIAGEGLDPVLVVGRSLAQDLFAEHRNANDVSEKVHHLFGPRQPTEVAVNDNAVEAMVNEQQQAAE